MLTYLEGLRFAKTMVTESQIVLAIFIMSFALILSEVVHRTIAAWFGSVLMLLYGHYTGVSIFMSNTMQLANSSRPTRLNTL